MNLACRGSPTSLRMPGCIIDRIAAAVHMCRGSSTVQSAGLLARTSQEKNPEGSKTEQQNLRRTSSLSAAETHERPTGDRITPGKLCSRAHVRKHSRACRSLRHRRTQAARTRGTRQSRQLMERRAHAPLLAPAPGAAPAPGPAAPGGCLCSACGRTAPGPTCKKQSGVWGWLKWQRRRPAAAAAASVP